MGYLYHSFLVINGTAILLSSRLRDIVKEGGEDGKVGTEGGLVWNKVP